MEKILRSEEMAEIMLLPVRHHSPACSFHLKKVIEAYAPSVILIEGPENANELIPVMIHPETQAPFAVYYSYHDKAGLLSEEKEHYKCYYPFLDYSPELTALRTADGLGIPVAFIDLSYADILASSAKGQGLRKKEEKNTYNDDYLLSRNAYIEKLCEKTGLRNFDEFWEKYFEIDGLSKESEEWFSDLLLYCTQARESTPREVIEDEGSLARERHMTENILQVAARNFASKQLAFMDVFREYTRILVVTGGFHTPSLAALLRDDKFILSAKKGNKTKKKEQNVYLMPYSMEAADSLNGYASGMPYPSFYQQIWEKLAESPESSYKETVLDFLVGCGKESRKKEGNISTFDEICALQMTEELALLRGKDQPGAYELFDAVLSSYIKGECTIATDTPLQILRKMMTGCAIGKLSGQAAVPPIIQDFEAQCKALSLKTGSTLESEITLSLFSDRRHRKISSFFHRMLFLKTAYARRLKGPNLQTRRDRNLIREIWKYKWGAQVNAALIDVSVYGATIEEAADALVREELKHEIGAGACAVLLTKVFEMGLTNKLQTVYERAQAVIQKDTDFYSLAKALSYLKMMREPGSLYQSELDFEMLLQLTVKKLISLLPSQAAVKEEDLNRCMNAVKLLYQLASEETREEFFEVLAQMQKDANIQAGLDGCIHGILYGGGKEDAALIERACLGYFKGSKAQMKKTALFFRGLFCSAKDLIFIEGQILKTLDEFLQQADNTEFMELLPELRMAFTYFTPREIDRIAEKAAALHGGSGEEVMRMQGVSAEWFGYGKEIDEFVRSRTPSKKISLTQLAPAPAKRSGC